MNTSRRSGARDTASRRDPFRAARLKLTFLYLAIITVVVVVLSSALYSLHAHDIAVSERRVPLLGGEAGGVPEVGFSVGEYLEELGRTIVVADVITIAVSGGLSYLLAARTLRPIKMAVEAEQQFFANAAHDLRTPLAVMRTEAEVALRSRELTTASARKVIGSSLEEIGRMSTMVEQMLDLARGAAEPGGRPAVGPVDLAELGRAAVAKMAARAGERGVRVTVEAPERAVVTGEALAIGRALDNVVENAVAYTPAGGTVSVAVRRRGGHVEVAVSDTGIGIAAADLPHITEAFYRGDRARGVHPGGAGLGLTIAKATMDAHRGAFEAASRPGSGTTITLRFPAA